MVVNPQRQYTFSNDGAGFHIQWTDYWYDRFDGTDMAVSSPAHLLTDLFKLPKYTYIATVTGAGGATGPQSHSMDPFAPPSVISVAKVAPALLGITASFIYYENLVFRDGALESVDPQSTGEMAIGVDVSRQQQFLWDYALTFDGAPSMITLGAAPLTVTFPGDYRRPGSAVLTQALTDDELWWVNQCANSIGVTGPQLMAILLQLTGARRNAYHPAGFYGISNLTQSQLALAGAGTVTDFVTASVRAQLAATTTYLTRQLPPTPGVLAVFFTLATGQPCPNPTASTVLQVGGAAMTGTQATTLISNTALDIANEFSRRLPAAVQKS